MTPSSTTQLTVATVVPRVEAHEQLPASFEQRRRGALPLRSDERLAASNSTIGSERRAPSRLDLDLGLPHITKWDIAGNWATSEQIPGVRIPGASFMGSMGVAPSASLRETILRREAELLARVEQSMDPNRLAPWHPNRP
jgi:hypothetical protein